MGSSAPGSYQSSFSTPLSQPQGMPQSQGMFPGQSPQPNLAQQGTLLGPQWMQDAAASPGVTSASTFNNPSLTQPGQNQQLTPFAQAVGSILGQTSGSSWS